MFVTADQGIEFQQNLQGLGVGVVVIRAVSNRMEQLLPLVGDVLSAIQSVPIESRIISRHSKQREDCFQKAVIKRGLRCMRRSALRARSFSSP